MAGCVAADLSSSKTSRTIWPLGSYYVFTDVNLGNAVRCVVSGIIAATGQTYLAESRLLVQESMHDSFVKALTVSNAIRAGTVWVDTYRAVSHMSPFGNYKQSGVGREIGIDAIYEYLQSKSI